MLDKVNRKRLNTQILTKTEVALQAIKKYDMQQSRVNFRLNPMNESEALVNEMEYNYSRLNSHRILTLDKKYKISLFTYSEEYYCLEMVNYIFPMRVIIRNVKNEGTIFIGYDQQYPGICQNSGSNPFNEHLSKQKNYDFKSVINQDMIIVLKNKGNRMVKNVYFTWIAGKSLFLCDFKVQFLGFVREERVMSEVKLKSDHKFQSTKAKKNANSSIPELKRTKTEPKQNLSERQNQFVRSKIFLRQKSEKPVLLEELNVFHRLQSMRQNSRQILSRDNSTSNKFTIMETSHTMDVNRGNTTFFNKKNLASLKQFRGDGKTAIKSDLDFKILQVQRNRVMFEEFKVKEKQLRELAGRCKRMIETEKKIFNEESVRKQKLNKDLAIILYSALFLKHTHRITDYQVKKENNKFRLGYLCSKFIRQLKKSHQHSCSIVHYKSMRTSIEGTSGIVLLTKSIAKQSFIRAERVIKQTFQFLNPLLLVKHSIFLSNSYRQKIRLIQRTWKQKYHNRLSSLLHFVDGHLQKMYGEFPHLQLFHEQFYKEGVNKQICIDYTRDESEKFRHIHRKYLRRLEEIDEINKMNLKNQMTKSSNKKLMVPRRPIRPMHRFYRNLDIMRSMVRTWFEIQYKKYMKKSGKKIKN